MKTCVRCGVQKMASEFHARSLSPDGLRPECKECRKTDSKSYFEKNRTRIREANKRYRNSPEVQERDRLRILKWQQDNPDKRSAQVALGNAVRDGRVVPWPVCAVPECDTRPVAHHPDYSAPLDVVWLCRSHHKKAHAIMKDLS